MSLPDPPAIALSDLVMRVPGTATGAVIRVFAVVLATALVEGH